MRLFAGRREEEARISKTRGVRGCGKTYLAVRVGRVFVPVHGVDVSAGRERGGGSGRVRTRAGGRAARASEARARVPTAGRADGPRAYLDTCDSTPW